ncbi:MAG TPA: T9SS type A sorting domain-containing protein [Ignavibacteriaceae bacterium]|nr:T9SS type A sorting domain-containing protein [Ignavibacteriaceae bacterium]
MKIVTMISICILSSLSFAQIQIQYINNVSEEFKERYYSQKREYNPLHVGNVWQYYYSDNNAFWTTKVVMDSVINGKQYFKKIYYETDPPTRNFVSWERNDTVNGVSFMLDFEDVNKNGDFLDELPLDSLENPYWSRYTTYKYSFNNQGFWSGTKTTLVGDTNWVTLDGDTVISRDFQILELFWWERVIEKFGIYAHMSESPIRGCTGAIINGKQYGTIVGVDVDLERTTSDFWLGDNYPNPFNPNTTITYSIPDLLGQNPIKIKLIVYDALGRVVATLVDEKEQSGSYSVNFNARALSSGVYYYSLISDSKRITKPMILIK